MPPAEPDVLDDAPPEPPAAETSSVQNGAHAADTLGSAPFELDSPVAEVAEPPAEDEAPAEILSERAVETADAERVGPPAQPDIGAPAADWTDADPPEAEPADDLPEFAPLDPSVSEPSPFDSSPYAPRFGPPVEAEPSAEALAEAWPGEHAGEAALDDATRRSRALVIALIVGLILLGVATGVAVFTS